LLSYRGERGPREDRDDAVVRDLSMMWKDQASDAIDDRDFLQSHIGKDLSGWLVAESLAIAHIEVFAGESDVVMEDVSYECMFDTLGLNAATEHQISHARFAVVDDGEAHDAVAAESIFAGEHAGIEMGCQQDLIEEITAVAVSRKVHLVGALREFMHALKIVAIERGDREFDVAVLQKCFVIFLEGACNLLSALFDLIHLAATDAIDGSWRLALGHIENQGVVLGVEGADTGAG